LLTSVEAAVSCVQQDFRLKTLLPRSNCHMSAANRKRLAIAIRGRLLLPAHRLHCTLPGNPRTRAAAESGCAGKIGTAA
jgi:hypothetical protein